MKLKKFVLVSFTSMLLFISCATVNQKVSLLPIKSEFPVSASQTLLSNDIVIDQEKIIESDVFKFTKVIKAPFHAKEFYVDIGTELKAQLDGTQFNGITQFNYSIKNIDSSVVSKVLDNEIFGLTLAGIGGVLLAVSPPSAGVSNVNNSAPNNGLLVPATIFMGIGVLLFGVGIYIDCTGTVDYTVAFSGLKIKF